MPVVEVVVVVVELPPLPVPLELELDEELPLEPQSAEQLELVSPDEQEPSPHTALIVTVQLSSSGLFAVLVVAMLIVFELPTPEPLKVQLTAPVLPAFRSLLHGSVPLTKVKNEVLY